MAHGRQFAWLMLGFLAATAVAAVLAVPPAHAQQPGATVGPRDLRPTILNRRADPPDLDTSNPAPDVPTITPETEPGDIPFADAGEEETRRPQIGRPVVVDGDPNWPPEPQAPRDGVLDQGVQDGVVEAIDPTRTDVRDQEDIDLFERPPAGFDPDAFGIELNPLEDRRIARITRLDPFAPIGIRIGSFIVFPELETAVAGYSNVLRSSTNPRPDAAFEVRPSARVVSNWRRHALELRASANLDFHRELPSENDRAYSIEARSRLDITRRTQLEATVGHDVRQELRGALDAASPTGPRSEVSTTTARVQLSHRFNRLTLQLRGTLTDTVYDEPAVGSAVAAGRGARDVEATEIATRASWQHRPDLQSFVEVAANARDFRAAAADGLERDSTGTRTRVGVSFGTTNQRLRGEVSVGYGEQSPDAPGLPAIRGIIVDANVGIRISALTSLLLSARSDITDSTTTGTSGALTRAVGAELRHAFHRRLIGIAALRASQADYVGIRLLEREITAELGLEYHLNRNVSLFGRYQHIHFTSTDAARKFEADEVRVGMRLRR